jgi:hypothetical protein
MTLTWNEEDTFLYFYIFFYHFDPQCCPELENKKKLLDSKIGNITKIVPVVHEKRQSFVY